MTTTEKKKTLGWKLLAGGLALAALSGTAAARDNVHFSLSIGVPAPVYVAPYAAPAAPTYIYERPVYYSPPPVVYAPPRVVYYPAPYYAQPPRARWHHRHGWR